MTPTILVTGATGVQGGSTARELLAKNIKVRAFVRDPTSQAALNLQQAGAVLFKGDFDDVPAIQAATAGVTGVFLNTYPNFSDAEGEIKYARHFVEAARAAGTVKTFVVSTVLKASEREELAAQKKEPFLTFYYHCKAGVEKLVREGGFENWTVLRPDWMYYNYLAPPCAIHFPD